jgi:BirA family biotin operon repressor/biotin-[acetyl-CoA-carboxylase] ligase
VTDLLDAQAICEGVLPALRPRLRRVTVLEEVDSTNSELQRLTAPERHAHALLAERQVRGRGRRQRSWHSPAGGNLYMSLGWQFRNGQLPLSTLPLVVAVCVAQALTRTGLQGHGIKWPNDILVEGAKLAGILVELQSSGKEGSTAVIGIGLNVCMPVREGEDPRQLIDRPWTDLQSHLEKGRLPADRNILAVNLLDQLLAALPRFEQTGFDTFASAWEKFDLLSGNPVTLDLDAGTVTGTAQGINNDGELMVAMEDGSVSSFHSGEVRVFHDQASTVN